MESLVGNDGLPGRLISCGDSKKRGRGKPLQLIKATSRACRDDRPSQVSFVTLPMFQSFPGTLSCPQIESLTSPNANTFSATSFSASCSTEK